MINARSVITGVICGVVFGAFYAQASDHPPIEAVPTQSAITSPTPQPPQVGASLAPAAPLVPDAVSRDKNGVPSLLVEFELDHSDIQPSFHRQLNAFGKYLRAHPGSTATLAGYADNSGHGPANGMLAQKRADAVMAYLATHYGIAANRISAQGYGMITDKPENSTVAARQNDRRVVGTITTAK